MATRARQSSALTKRSTTNSSSRIEPEHPQKSEALRDECADVLLYLLLIADKAGFDLAEAAHAKLVKNAAKYPVDKAFGSRAKYTELG